MVTGKKGGNRGSFWKLESLSDPSDLTIEDTLNGKSRAGIIDL